MPGTIPPSPDESDRIQQQLISLERFVTDSLSSSRDESQRQLLLFIKRTLLQFNLEQEYNSVDILGEAYFRAIVKIRSGESIRNIPGFFNRLSFNIIREKRRSYSRQEKIDTKYIAINNDFLYENFRSYDNEYKDEYVNNLRELLNEISKDNLDILVLRIVKGLSWDEVRDYYLKRGEDISIACLRKRGSRALIDLRQKFFAITQTEPS